MCHKILVSKPIVHTVSGEGKGEKKPAGGEVDIEPDNVCIKQVGAGMDASRLYVIMGQSIKLVQVAS